MFKRDMSNDELCALFKQKAKEFYETSEKPNLVIELNNLEEFFGYSAKKLQTSWIPKQFRDGLRKIGVRLHKKRSRNDVLVILDEK